MHDLVLFCPIMFCSLFPLKSFQCNSVMFILFSAEILKMSVINYYSSLLVDIPKIDMLECKIQCTSIKRLELGKQRGPKAPASSLGSIENTVKRHRPRRREKSLPRRSSCS